MDCRGSSILNSYQIGLHITNSTDTSVDLLGRFCSWNNGPKYWSMSEYSGLPLNDYFVVQDCKSNPKLVYGTKMSISVTINGTVQAAMAGSSMQCRLQYYSGTDFAVKLSESIAIPAVYGRCRFYLASLTFVIYLAFTYSYA